MTIIHRRIEKILIAASVFLQYFLQAPTGAHPEAQLPEQGEARSEVLPVKKRRRGGRKKKDAEVQVHSKCLSLLYTASIEMS